MTTWFDRFLPTIDLTIPEATEAMTDFTMLIEYNLYGFRHDNKHILTSYHRPLTQNQNSLPKKSIYQIAKPLQ